MRLLFLVHDSPAKAIVKLLPFFYSLPDMSAKALSLFPLQII